ncbi:helix-turn-helix domain-containing protein [Nocardia takedensis]
MDDEVRAVGDRIRSIMPEGLSQRQLAQRTGMKTDALSRALNGQRGFSSVELARIADELDADLYWLITGDRDPHRVRIAARHSWDSARQLRVNPGRPADEELIRRVAETYTAAYPEGPPSSEPLPANPAAMRELLGEHFVREYGAVVEDRLGVDVVRLPMLSTDYSLSVGSRAVVILATTPYWFRSNWSLAHELAHFALGHHAGDTAPGEADEAPADRFAAEFLLPEEMILREDWRRMDHSAVVEFLWRTGVSTRALGIRLGALGVTVSTEVVSALKRRTLDLIRDTVGEGRTGIGGVKQLIVRQQQSAARVFPASLVDALQKRVETGAASPEHLAWVLDVPVDVIDFPEPDEDIRADDDYERAFVARPSVTDLEDWLAARSRSAR